MKLREFNSLVGGDSYILSKGKVRIDKSVVEVDTAERHLFQGGSNTIGWWVRPGYVVVDIDEGKEEAKIMIKKLGIKTLVCETNKGLHLYFKTDTEVKQGQGMTLPCGLKCDTRSAGKGYVLLPFGVEGRKFFGAKEIAPLPLELTPIHWRKESLFGLKEGGGRNELTFKQLIAYKNNGASPEQIEDMAKIINHTIFGEPMEEKEIRKVINNVHEREAQDEQNPYILYTEKGKPQKMNQRAIRDAFIARGDTFVIGGDKGGDCYQYKEGIYKSDGKAVRRQIESMVNVDSLISHKTIGDCYNFITDSEELRKYPQDLNSDKNLINFKNGVWNIETQELLPHDQKYLQTIQVPHEVLKADKPWEKTRIYRFLSEKCKLQEEDINMIADFMAYCLTLKPLKAFMSLYGPSNTGKTVLITFMEKLVGQENVSSVTMKQLSKDKWHTAQLMDKLLNSSGDENTADLPGVDELKRVTGSDNITNEKKGKDPFYFKPFVKLVYSFNMLPLQRGDKSDAYFKRLRVLNMNTVLELDEDFVDELHSELSIREAIPHLLDRLPLKGISNSPRSLKLVETLRQDSDSIHAFISKKCVEGKNETVEKKRLFLEYKTFCADNQLDAYGLQEFYRLLKSKGYKEIRGKAHEYSFKGIGLKSKGGRRK